MTLDVLKNDLYEAQKAGNTLKVSVLRYLLSEIKNKEIELRPQGQELTDEVILKVLNKQVKRREEIIEVYSNAGRQDLADKETAESGILKEYVEKFRDNA